MKASTIAWIVVVVVIVIGGIYWFAVGSGMNNQSATSQATTTPTTAPVLTVSSNAQFPNYLAAANGMALYTFKSDTAGVSNCTGACAAIWPPYTVSSTADLTPGANVTGTIATITRADGTVQLTYNGMPLYFFAKDTSVGMVTGNGDNGFSIATPTAATAQPAASASASVPAATAPATPAPAPTTPAPSAPGYSY